MYLFIYFGYSAEQLDYYSWQLAAALHTLLGRARAVPGLGRRPEILA